jgi:hypothetical protein
MMSLKMYVNTHSFKQSIELNIPLRGSTSYATIALPADQKLIFQTCIRSPELPEVSRILSK